MADESDGQTEVDAAYHAAIERFKAARRVLAECDIDIEVAQILTDMVQLRHLLSARIPLLDAADNARDQVRDRRCDVVRYRGMGPREKRQADKPGIVHQIIDKLSRF